MTNLSLATSFILLLIAALHLLWGFDVYFPATDETSLAQTVVGAQGITRMPSFFACSFVSVALLIGTGIVLRLGGVLELSAVPLWLFRLAGAGFAFVLLARGIVGFLPFWAEVTPEQPFRTLDKRFFSPLCIALGLAVASLLVGSRGA